MNETTRATAIAALEDMIEAYKLSGYSKKDMDEVQAALADLRAPQQAQAGQVWQPVDDGMIYHHTESVSAEWNYPAHVESIEFLEVRDNGDTIAIGSMPKEDEHTGHLPRNVRFCKLTPAPVAQGMPSRQLIERAINGVLLGISDDSVEAAEAVRAWLDTLQPRPVTGEVSPAT